MDSCPKELDPFVRAHSIKLREKDALVHAWVGNYGISALSVAISHCFSKKSQAKYVEDRILKDEISKETSEDKIRAQREKLMAGLLAMQANFEIEKKKEK